MSSGAVIAKSTTSPAAVPRKLGVYRDIYRSLFEQSGMCMANLDLEARVLEANESFCRQFGRTTHEMQDRSFCGLLHPSVRGVLKHQLKRLAEGQHPRFDAHMLAVGPKESVFAGELTGVAVRGDGRVETIMVLVKPEEEERPPRLAGAKQKLLSPVDARILEGVAAGESTVQLAAKLFLSRGGVEYHVTTLLRKLKVTNRPALVSKGYSLGILELSRWPPRVCPEYIR
ncbi:PAS domain S-box protein [Saccharopolyspora erythraea]|uniref:LuxR C-terminal-related transcriptional regulator n=1 Tax=Saccharopolyspora erythraea TaxID=1836 RepID=UPI001BA94938|nr:LuxR C-terminal-related transcriptional regulator [Saccharopolyspora erythraea]QUH01941.1 PAS domain S-box protein [Saccharopolyspora erythraea]